MAPVVLVFALRQNGRVGSQYPKAQEFEAANATLGWLLGQALKIHLGEGGITPAARDMCHWSTTVQNEEHPAHGFCSSDDRHTSLYWIHVNIHSHQMNRLWEYLERLVQFTCMCRFVPFVWAFLALYSVQLPPLPQRNEKVATQMRRSMMITYCNPAILLCWRFYEMLCVNVYQMNSFKV